jgi:hypothetical protein
MRRWSVVLSVIAIVWGGAILFVRFTSTASNGGSASTTGAIAAILFAIVLLVVGLYGLRYELRRQSRNGGPDSGRVGGEGTGGAAGDLGADDRGDLGAEQLH